MAARNPGGEERAKGGFRAAIFFLAVFFRVTRDGLSERGITRSLFFTHSSRHIRWTKKITVRSKNSKLIISGVFDKVSCAYLNFTIRVRTKKGLILGQRPNKSVQNSVVCVKHWVLVPATTRLCAVEDFSAYVTRRNGAEWRRCSWQDVIKKRQIEEK